MTLSPTRQHLMALGAFVLLAVLFTWPLVLHFDTHVIGPYHGDNFEYVWKTWWVSHAIFDLHRSPLHVPNINYPDGYDLAYGEITPIHTYLFAPLTALIGPIPVYNLVILWSIVASGWGMYFLARAWLLRLPSQPDGQAWIGVGAFFAGVAFTFCAYRMQRIVGHLPLIDTQWLILAVWALDRWLDHQRRWDALWLALGISLAALSSWYYALMLLWFLPIYVLARGDDLRQLLRQKQTWQAVALVGLVVAGLCGPFLWPYRNIFSSGESKVPLSDASFWAASPLDYLMPNPRQPIWGRPVRFVMWPINDDMPLEFMISLEWIVLFLAWRGWKQVGQGRWRALKWVMGVAFVLSLGPYLHLGRIPLGIPMPALPIRAIVPGADGLRSWGRFSVLVQMGACLLAAVGLVRWLSNKPAQRQRLYAIGMTGLLLFSVWVGPAKLVKIEPRPIDHWLAEQPDDAPIMQYPIASALSGPSMLYTRYHHKPVLFGYGTYFPFIFKERHPDLYDFPENVALDELEQRGVHYILIDLDQLNDDTFAMDEVEAQPRLRHVITLDGEAVYEIVATP